jgi:putative FmdB family regulatory protein
MPTYQYVCNDCGHEFEEFQRISELPLTECPRCKGHVERVITGGAGFLFKGSGFYITDYRSKDYKDAAKKDSESSSTPSRSESKNDSKPSSSAKKAEAGAAA